MAGTQNIPPATQQNASKTFSKKSTFPGMYFFFFFLEYKNFRDDDKFKKIS